MQVPNHRFVARGSVVAKPCTQGLGVTQAEEQREMMRREMLVPGLFLQVMQGDTQGGICNGEALSDQEHLQRTGER